MARQVPLPGATQAATELPEREVELAALDDLMTELPGASNAKANRELAWRPAYPSWRQGFAVA